MAEEKGQIQNCQSVLCLIKRNVYVYTHMQKNIRTKTDLDVSIMDLFRTETLNMFAFRGG